MKVTLYIEGRNGVKQVELARELSVGRTPQAQLVLDDEGLSRVNTTFFIDGDEVLVADENSTNGTFVNGERISGRPVVLRNGDRLKLGSHTTIRVEIDDGRTIGSTPVEPKELPTAPSESSQNSLNNGAAAEPLPERKPPWLLIAAAAMTLVIVVFAGIALLVGSGMGGASGPGAAKTPPPIASRIPVRVIDPLGGEDEDDLDDLIASWETEENPLQADDLKAIDATTGSEGASDLNVSIDFWKKQLERALNHGATGAEPSGLIQLPEELFGGNVSKQKAKLSELINRNGYQQPMDFGDLARLRLEGKFLGELPMATESYVLDIGGSATGDEFMSFDFATDGSQVRAPITPGTPKYQYLKQLADNFDGQKYNLNDPADRKQMRIRLLRMYNKEARKGFEELTRAFYQQFKVPLRVTSLTRSMDYQIDLNKSNANSYKVSGRGSLPPHTSGCAFDVSRKNLTADEQNFLMRRLAELERDHKLDSLREGRANACFHSFFYPDGIEPNLLKSRFATVFVPADTAANFPFLGFFNRF